MLANQDKVGQLRARARRGPLSEASRAELQAKAWTLHIEGLGYRDIGAQLGVSKDTVASLVHGEAEERATDRKAYRQTDMERAIATYRT